MARIALPIDSKVRELDGKVWLALNLINNGHKVALGQKGDIRYTIDLIKPDIYFEKAGSYDAKRNKRGEAFSKTGTDVFILDEEGAIYRSEEHFVAHRLSSKVLKNTDCYLAWGSKVANVIKNNFDFSSDKIEVTGHPRFDLLNQDLREIYRPKANSHQNKFGDYILVITNFTKSNSPTPELIEKRKQKRKFDVEKEIEYERELQNMFLNFVKEYNSNDPNTTIIIRPHPYEDVETYKKEFSNTDCVQIHHEGDVRSWILGSKAVVHNGSTAGIESGLLNVPVFSYQPIKKQTYHPKLPDLLSDEIRSEEKLIQSLQSIHNVDNYTMGEEQRRRIKQHFHNYDTLAVDDICDIINERNINTGEFREFASNKKQLERMLKKIPVTAKFERWLGRDSPHQFDELTPSDLEEVIAKFEHVINIEQTNIEKIAPWKDAYWLFKPSE